MIELPGDSEDEGSSKDSEKDWAKMVEKELSPRQSPVDSGCQSGETPPVGLHLSPAREVAE